MTNKISDKDKKDWENFISSKEEVPNKDHKLKKGKRFTTKSIDLHGYTLEEANKSIQDFINDVKIKISISRKKIRRKHTSNHCISTFRIRC